MYMQGAIIACKHACERPEAFPGISWLWLSAVCWSVPAVTAGKGCDGRRFCWHGPQFPSVDPSLASLNSLSGPVKAQSEPALGCTHPSGLPHMVPPPMLPVGGLLIGGWGKEAQATSSLASVPVPGRSSPFQLLNQLNLLLFAGVGRLGGLPLQGVTDVHVFVCMCVPGAPFSPPPK